MVLMRNFVIVKNVNYKTKTHNYFDLLWQEKLMTRQQAYFKLKKWMGFKSLKETHIKLMSEEQCHKLIEILKNEFPNLYKNKDYLENDLFYS